MGRDARPATLAPGAVQAPSPASLRALVIMPTYQEAPNVAKTLAAVRQEAPSFEVLIVDDSSPDGTADLARSYGRSEGGVHVLVRPAKSGLGSAYRDGLRWGLDRGYEALVTMDADGSHDPALLGPLVAELEKGADVVLGSRYCPGGKVVDWPLRRRLLSRLGNRYATFVLRLRVHDATAGFRAYRAEWLQAFDATQSESEGYCVHVEMTYRCQRAGARLVEVPITFCDRRYGQSKMSARIVAETFRNVTRWAVRGQRGGRVLTAPDAAVVDLRVGTPRTDAVTSGWDQARSAPA
jgi:dolichol-phosphate mannosyltransferase